MAARRIRSPLGKVLSASPVQCEEDVRTHFDRLGWPRANHNFQVCPNTAHSMTVTAREIGCLWLTDASKGTNSHRLLQCMSPKVALSCRAARRRPGQLLGWTLASRRSSRWAAALEGITVSMPLPCDDRRRHGATVDRRRPEKWERIHEVTGNSSGTILPRHPFLIRDRASLGMIQGQER